MSAGPGWEGWFVLERDDVGRVFRKHVGEASDLRQFASWVHSAVRAIEKGGHIVYTEDCATMSVKVPER